MRQVRLTWSESAATVAQIVKELRKTLQRNCLVGSRVDGEVDKFNLFGASLLLTHTRKFEINLARRVA